MRLLILVSMFVIFVTCQYVKASVVNILQKPGITTILNSTDGEMCVYIHPNRLLEGFNLIPHKKIFNTWLPERPFLPQVVGLTHDKKILLACWKGGYIHIYETEKKIKGDEDSIFSLGMESKYLHGNSTLTLSPQGNWFFVFDDEKKDEEIGFSYGANDFGPRHFLFKKEIRGYTGGYALKKIILSNPTDHDRCIHALLFLWGERTGLRYSITLRNYHDKVIVDPNPVPFLKIPKSAIFDKDGAATVVTY